MKTFLKLVSFNKMHRTLSIICLLSTLVACGGGGGSAGGGSNTPDSGGPVPDTTAPTLSITPAGSGQTVNEGDSISFTGTASDTIDGNISTNIIWSLDGTAQTTAGNWNATFPTAGGFSVTANISDAANNAATEITYTVTVVAAGGGGGGGGSSTSNPDLNETTNGFKDAILLSLSPDCTAYATDTEANWDLGLSAVDYDSHGITDTSNLTNTDPFFPGTNTSSYVRMDLVIATSWNQPTYDYDNVAQTNDLNTATHCRMFSNMVPNHDFGLPVEGPNGNGWINAIDHQDWQVTYIPVSPTLSTSPGVPFDTPRNPTVYMDYDGIILNGVGIAMDSGFCYRTYIDTGALSLQSNDAGNSSGCGGNQGWHELPAYNIFDPSEPEMAANFDPYFAHGFVGTYHYHAITHPLTDNTEQTAAPHDSSGNDISSPVIGFAADGFPIYGHWFEDGAGNIVQAESGYSLINSGINPDASGFGQTRAEQGTELNGIPPTQADLDHHNDVAWVGGTLSPDGTARDYRFFGDPLGGGFVSFGLELGRYEWDWEYDSGNTGNLDQCNGRTNAAGDFVGYYVTDKYPFTPPCTWGDRELSFGKAPPHMPVGFGNGTNEESPADQTINGHMPVPAIIQ